MKCSFFKYDVAISVATEDKEIARQIAREMKKNKVRYYYYEEMMVESWGEYIIDLTADAYGRRSLLVLMITSKYYAEKYWSGIERQFAMANTSSIQRRILQLKLDSTVIDGYSKHIVNAKWNDNPVEFVALLKAKLRVVKKKARWRCFLLLTRFILITGALSVSYFYAKPKPRTPRQPSKIVDTNAVMVTGYSSLEISNPSTPASQTKKQKGTFYISNTEVTVGQFRKYCHAKGLLIPLQPNGSYEYTPIVNVNWYDALAYCKWVGGRLPSSKEWEYAASGGIDTKYSGSTNASNVAVYGVLSPKNVGSKKPNQFGIYDMTGNVAEWCVDVGSNKNLRVVRGGAYNSLINPVNQLSIYNITYEPDTIKRPYIGFRVAWDQKPSK